MREDVDAILSDLAAQDPSGVADALDDEDQIKIITKAVGPKPGTHIAGVGQDFTRTPRPRGPKVNESSHHLADELEKVKEEFARTTTTLVDRIKMLEEMHSANARAPSEGASYVPIPGANLS